MAVTETLPPARKTLAQRLDQQSRIGVLWRTEGEKVRCFACGHRCLIAPEHRGICKVRYNRNGSLYVPYGYVAGLASDPVEKKPFFHALPGSDALTFGMLGCDFHCAYCQNWMTSQALRDDAALAPIRMVTPAQIAQMALRAEARWVISSYNEPLITAEWAQEVFQEARNHGLLCAFVSNGNATAEALDFIKPWIIAYKVDLKTFNDQHYRTLGGVLDHVVEAIRLIHERGIWLEILTLLIPGFNDSDAELRDIARFIAKLDRNIPWHVTAFHKDYRMRDPANTTARDLLRAAEIGANEGLHYVYAGNLPGRVGEWENTRCPSCQFTLVQRYGYVVESYSLTADGKCPKCNTTIPGIWASPDGYKFNTLQSLKVTTQAA